ncbi:MAG: hypothetical protein ABS911_09850 [Carnobacterium sp.]|uniref:hypothetical protein n=1 Tax=Carnobacterium sp. TaxID=48221 RepID=UPI0033156D40
MAGGPNYKINNDDTCEEALITIYQVENDDLEEVIGKLAKKNNLVIDTKKKHESAAIGDLAGLSLEITNILNHPTFIAVLNFAAAVPIGKFLFSIVSNALKKGKSFKLSDNGIGYIAKFLNKDKVSEKNLEVIGPFSISNPNSTLDNLVDINISGLDKIFGVLIAFKFEKSEKSNQTNWEIYNNQGKLILSWETYEDK